MIDIKVLATGSTGNCYRVTDGSTPLLLECGIRYKSIQQALNFRVSEIKGCLVTHEHKDHCAGVTEVMKRGIPVYMSQGTAEAIETDIYHPRIVRAKEQFTIGTWTILPFDVQHDVSEPMGYLMMNQAGEKLLFATDTYYIKYKFKGLTHLMVECNYSMDILNENIESGRVHKAMKNRLIRSHFSLENMKEFLHANDLSNLQSVHLLHLSDSNSNEKLFKEEVQKITGTIVHVA
ncbi:MBL fold metallo-hydrolase [Terribacillus saccharophilus]|uniref:MBL fold metallo-hydrolase n=1 Tax=Terribacillus saccharophilus TaxID=361277 RepID=UPI000BA734C2|nr:MBL fold metallo-hydrolase [Terribacillus saccharophilus]PAF15930.1 MBL fold metallo-hydrolase [Terribacillus saccharophilus]